MADQLPSDAYYHDPIGMPYHLDYNARWQKRNAQGVCPCGGSDGSYVKNTSCLNYKTYGYNCSGVRVDSDGSVKSMDANDERGYSQGPDFGTEYAATHPKEFAPQQNKPAQ